MEYTNFYLYIYITENYFTSKKSEIGKFSHFGSFIIVLKLKAIRKV